MKTLAKWMLQKLAALSGCGVVGGYFHDLVIVRRFRLTERVTRGNMTLEFATPNALCRYRVKTFFSKEPETLAWLDSIPQGAVLWDIGANVGLYTCYAASQRNCRVVAFEPSVFNLELLARNVFLNGLMSTVTIAPLALTDQLGVATMKMTSIEWGGALSTFGKDYGHDGKTLVPVFEFPTLGITMDDAAQMMQLPAPEYLKIDVDGIEHLILSGGSKVLAGTKSVLVEINDDFAEQAGKAADLLLAAGFILHSKLHSDLVEDSSFSHAYNQIWWRPS